MEAYSDLLLEITDRKTTKWSEVLKLLKLYDNGCRYENRGYKNETKSKYLTMIQRNVLKTKVKTIGDFIMLVEHIIGHVSSKYNRPTNKKISKIVSEFKNEYDTYKLELNRVTAIESVSRVARFYVLVNALAYVVENVQFLQRCKKEAWFASYSCSDLQMFISLTGEDQKCKGIVDEILLGLAYTIMEKRFSKPGDLYKMLMQYVDISAKKRSNWGKDNLSLFDNCVNQLTTN